MSTSVSQPNHTTVHVTTSAASGQMAQGNTPVSQQQPQQQQTVTPQQQQIHLQHTTTTTAIHGAQQQQHHHAAQSANTMQQLQVIQQPIQNHQYLQQLYNTQGQLLMNGNIALHHPGINPQIQVIAAGKTFQPNQLGAHQMLTAATSYTAIPTTAANNQQAYIIGQLINSQGGLIQQHQQQGKPGEMPKVLSPQIGTQLQQGLWTSAPNTLFQHPIFIRGTQPDQMFIQQQQPLHTNTSTNQHFSMQPIAAATAQLPATSISAGTPNNMQSNAQQQQQNNVQQANSQQQQNQQLAPQPIQPQPPNVVSIKAPATLQPKPPLQIQPQPTQSQQQQHHQMQQQIQQVMSHPQHQLQIIPQPPTSQTNVISQPVMAAPQQQTITMQANPNQAQMHSQQQPRQLTILPQQQQPQAIQPQVSVVQQQHQPGNQQPQPIRPNYTIVTQGTASVPVSQVQTSIANTISQGNQPRPKVSKKVVGRGNPTASPNTPQQNNKTVFPRPTQLSTTISPMPTQAKPSNLHPQQTTGATLTKVQMPNQGQTSQQPMIQPLKTINMSALQSPPNLPDATLTPLNPQSNPHAVSSANQVSQPMHVYTASTQLPSPNVSITPAPPPQPQQQQQRPSTPAKKDELVEMVSVENKVETEKENTKSTADETEDSSAKHNKLPKAMVKPQVLTHVLGGFVIQESAEPFPMPRNGELDEPPKKKAAISPTEEMGKCEMCGKVDVKAKFKKNKRFCSSACAKSSKSAAQQQQQNQQQQVQVSNNSIPNGTSNNASSDKLKQKNRKWARGDGDADLTDETNSSVGETSSLSPNEDQNDDEPKVNPVKWNVSEVVEFVKSLPGCAEYAEDFAVQEIDGQALLLLKEDHLMSAMGMKLGPALKLCAKIESIRSSNSAGNGDTGNSKA